MKVYLIGNKHFCKIGIASNPESRAAYLDNPKLPFSVAVLTSYDAGREAHKVEKTLHKLYGDKHLRGEWFSDIDPAEFKRAAKVIHRSCSPVKAIVKTKPKIDPRVTWAEEWAFGERMLAFIDKLERNPRC